ncbi:MAG: hypothetical protein VX554_01750, partial [Candidatus Thermoplasmatota archaeon]|nr:hypothetical protein [Candidatus Thermoplasmatota archaeon]
FDEPQPVWSAYREATYGYTVFEVTPQGDLHFSFIRNSDNAVTDQFWISKAEPLPEPGGSDNNATTPDENTSDAEPAWRQKIEELPGPGLPIALGAMAIAARRRR